jgi:hypothetical protein
MREHAAQRKRPAGKEIRGADISYLEREFVRCGRGARNPTASRLRWFGMGAGRSQSEQNSTADGGNWGRAWSPPARNFNGEL